MYVVYLDIYEAIENRRLIQMYYGDYFRVIEPRLYGNDFRGVDVLKAFQVAGSDAFGRHPGWKWFRAKDMDSVVVLSTKFWPHRLENTHHDRTLQRVYCQVKDAAVGMPPVERRDHRRR